MTPGEKHRTPPVSEPPADTRKTTGERVSHTTIWKLRNGQATKPAEAPNRGDGADFWCPAVVLSSATTMRIRPT